MARFIRQNGKLVNANAQTAVVQPQAEHPQWWIKSLKLCYARYEKEDDTYRYFKVLNDEGSYRYMGVRKPRDNKVHAAQRLHSLEKGTWYHLVIGADRGVGYQYTGSAELLALLYTPTHRPGPHGGIAIHTGRVTGVVSCMPFKVDGRACECHQMSLELAGYQGITYKTVPSLWQEHVTETVLALKGKKVAAMCGASLVMGVSELTGG